MKEFKGTPGPWQVVPDAQGYSREMAECIVWGPDGPGHGSVAHTSPFVMPYPGGRQAADALAIAAVHEMIEALLAVKAAYASHQLYDKCPLALIDRALQKAGVE